MKIITILFVSLIFAFNITSAELTINELSSKNDEYVVSIDGEYHDWIEFYNSSDSELSLSGLYLTDDIDELDMWEFLIESVPAKSFLVVFCSDKDDVIGGEAHTNFKLSSDGETVYLTDGTSILDSMEFGTINEDYSYGRLDEESKIKTNLTYPTPFKSNSLSGTIIADRESGYYLSDFDLELIAADGAEIYYTTNGDVPTDDSELYSESVRIADEYEEYEYLDTPTTPGEVSDCAYSWKPVTEEVPRCRVISYRAKNEDGSWGRTHSKSFFFQNNHNLPVVSIVTDNMCLFSQDTGIYVPGIHWDKNDPCNSGNYHQRGRDWERAGFFSFFKEEKLVAEFNSGIRIHGSGSRGSAQKGLRLYARKEYGIDKFENKFLPEIEVKEFDNFLIRGTMNDFSHTLMKDAVTMEAVKNLNLTQNYVQPILLYINGIYWGVQEIRNRFDEAYLADLSGADKDSIRIVAPVVFGNPWQQQYKEMKVVYDFIVEKDLTINTNYDYIASKYDIPQLIDYLIAETYFANTDWPGNNLIFWKESYDAKYKPLFYDLDAGWKDRELDMIDFFTQQNHNDYPNPSSTTVIFYKLLENVVFRTLFVERALDLVDGEFSFQNIEPIIEKFTKKYGAELSNNIDRWSFPRDRQNWEYRRFYDIYEFARLRSCFYKEHLVNYFNLDSNLLCIATSVDYTFNYSDELFPNPAKTHIQLDADKTIGELTIINVSGKIVKTIEQYSPSDKINIEELSSGLYFVRFDNRLFKFVKIK